MSYSNNWNKKAALFASGLVCALAFRIPISTAAFCVTRFRLDLTLLGIYVSRMLNGIMISWQLGQWTAISVLRLTGTLPGTYLNVEDGEAKRAADKLKTKLQAKFCLTVAVNLIVLLCFCSALFFFCHSEEGNLTGYYWSIIIANFWWKWSEAFTININGSETNWHIVTLILSAIYTAALKSLVMLCVNYCCGSGDGKNDRINILGNRSIKVNVDYLVATGMILITIILDLLMCFLSTPLVVKTNGDQELSDNLTYYVYGLKQDEPWFTVKEHCRAAVLTQLQTAATTIAITDGNNQLAATIRKIGTVKVRKFSDNKWGKKIETLDFGTATVNTEGIWLDGRDKIVIEVFGLKTPGEANWNTTGIPGNDKITKQMNGLVKKAVPVSVNVKSAYTYKGASLSWHVVFTMEETTHIPSILRYLRIATSKLKDADASDNKLAKAIQGLGTEQTVDTSNGEKTLNFTSATVNHEDSGVKVVGENKIAIHVGGVQWSVKLIGLLSITEKGMYTLRTANYMKTQLNKLISQEKISTLTLNTGNVPLRSAQTTDLTITVTLKSAQDLQEVLTQLQTAATTIAITGSNNKLAATIHKVSRRQNLDTKAEGGETILDFSSAEVNTTYGVAKGNTKDTITITVNKVKSSGSNNDWRNIDTGRQTSQAAKSLKTTLDNLIGTGKIKNVDLNGNARVGNTSAHVWLDAVPGYMESLKITVNVNNTVGAWVTGELDRLKSSLLREAINAGSGVGNMRVSSVSAASSNKITIKINNAPGVGAVHNEAIKANIEDKIESVMGLIECVDSSNASFGTITITSKDTDYVKSINDELRDVKNWVLATGLGGGTALGALVGFIIGLIIGSFNGNEKSAKLSGLLGGGLLGALLGIMGTEIYQVSHGSRNEEWTVWCSMLLVVLGMGTVYSVYPGMAPCSITQFHYFNIIDILILILSSIPPLVFVFLSFAKPPMDPGGKGTQGVENSSRRIWYCVIGIVFLVAQNMCQMITIYVLQNPESELSEKVTLNPMIAGALTLTIQISEHMAIGVGFGGAAGWPTNNQGFVELQHTTALLVAGVAGVLGEGYLTELKKYEPGTWPIQWLGGFRGFWWWAMRIFSNAWKILTCICTRDMRRDLILFHK